MTIPEPLAPRRLAARVGGGLLVLLSVVFALSLLLHEPLTVFSAWFVSHLGLAGLFVGVIFTDASPLPLTHEPLLLFAWSGGVGFWTIFGVASSASVTSGVVGWSLGRLLRGRPWLERWFHRYRVDTLLDRYGAAAVGVAALTPFPFAIATWSAGAGGLPLKDLLLGALMRIPKVLFYLSLIVLGWGPGA